MGETISGAAEAPEPPIPAPPPAPPARSMAGEVLGQSPYIAMLAASFGGVAYAAFTETPNAIYWMVMAPLFGLLCVVAGWAAAPDRGGRLRLIWTQGAHWAAFLLAMLLLFRPEVQGVMQGRASEIGLLLLLALGAFVAGVHAGSWRIVAVGALLGLAVPLLAFIQQSALLIVAAALLMGAAGAVFLWAASRAK
ncbi:hypothetical protein J5Y09_23020 [Roseomonas sp. PWR1]|uniref:Uncharacterized protein n=1 Tax=Roseomonas nitratireducens TaxID=2820810 RepID=A0ABS4AZP7_9PROT|nr:hypothetical protein [Neoroseomonas nitratireducens]MBP0466819.1 hypothetical protein [Neoroseomonas nitratireducens]